MKYVYLLKAGEDHYKVGVATSVTRRVAGIQTSNGHKVYVIATRLCKDYYRVEREIHKKLKDMGAGGGTEWFRLEPEDVIRIAILLNSEPEIDVYANVDLNSKLTEERLRYKRLEKKLDLLINIAQKPRSSVFNVPSETELLPILPTKQDAENDLFNEARDIVIKEQRASTSMLQMRLKIGYGRAARLIREMEEQGIVGPLDGIRARKVLLMPA